MRPKGPKKFFVEPPPPVPGGLDPRLRIGVKLLNFTFCGGREHKDDDFLFLFLNFDSLENSTPEKFSSIWRTEQDGISAIKLEAARILILVKWCFRSRLRRCCLKQLKKRRRYRERQKSKRLNSFACAWRFFVCFLAVVARLRRETSLCHVLCRTWTQDNCFLFVFFLTQNQTVRILLQKNWSTYLKLNEME